MPCAFCGEGDKWIKTCRTKDGSRLRICDPCWEVLSPWLVIVPGDEVVTARCNGCGAYFNPREMAQVSPGGRYDAYSGICEMCAKTVLVREAIPLTRKTS
jgi:hypothetical protein